MIDSRRTAFIFPGQGSQAVGMGADLAQHYHVARQTFQEADEILGFDLSTLCFEGPEQALSDTVHAQPALYVSGIATLRTLYEVIGEVFEPAMMAGHSLGEITALTAAGAMSFPAGLRLVQRRGELMREAGTRSPGGMAAVLGLDVETVRAACREAAAESAGIVVVANDNCPGQVVIAGDEGALAAAMSKMSALGARRVVRLAVSIPAHSPLMSVIADSFAEAIDGTPMHAPVIPVVGNVYADPLKDVGAIRADLREQLTSPVRWTESIQHMSAHGISTYVELGSKDVLVGLVKRIDRDAERFVVDTPAGIDEFMAALQG